MITLIIDTANNRKNIVGLRINNKEFIQAADFASSKTQMILPMIDKILKEHELKMKDISAIQVNVGPGSYTGLRIGLAIANTLSFVFKIPINEKKIGEIILPIYT